MKFKDFEFTSDNHFIAMQYFGLILNRTYLVILTRDRIVGIKVNGMVSVEGGGHVLAKEISGAMAVRGDLSNPYSYVKSKYLERLQALGLDDADVLAQDKSNFVIQRTDIIEAYHDPRKKWGMGYYPHDGKVYVVTKDRNKKEYIILGNQSGQRIAHLIGTK